MSGPTVTLSLSCEGCDHLVRSVSRPTAYGCREPSVLEAYGGETQIVGLVSQVTPAFCPLRRAAIARAVELSLTRRDVANLREDPAERSADVNVGDLGGEA